MLMVLRTLHADHFLMGLWSKVFLFAHYFTKNMEQSNCLECSIGLSHLRNIRDRGQFCAQPGASEPGSQHLQTICIIGEGEKGLVNSGPKEHGLALASIYLGSQDLVIQRYRVVQLLPCAVALDLPDRGQERPGPCTVCGLGVIQTGIKGFAFLQYHISSFSVVRTLDLNVILEASEAKSKVCWLFTSSVVSIPFVCNRS
eukprot:g40141.t1